MTADTVSLLPPISTPWELAAEATGAARFQPIWPTPVQNAMNTGAIPAAFLPWLAWGLGLEIWNPDWPEARKRWACANSIAWHRQKGTYAGLSAYLNLVGCDLVAAVVPPARTYLSPALTAAQRAQYLTGFNQLRVLPYVAGALAKFAAFTTAAYGLPEAYLGFIYPHQMGAEERYTRTAEIWSPWGAQLSTLALNSVTPEDVGSISSETYDAIVLPATPPPPQIYLGNVFPADGAPNAMFGAGFAIDLIVNLPVTTSFVFAAPRVTNQAISGGTGLVDVTPTDVLQVHDGIPGQAFLTGRAFLAQTFMPPSAAWQYIYQLWYLFDPALAPQGRNATTFLDWTRLGMPPYTAELQVDIEGTVSPGETWKYVAGCLRSPRQSAQQISDALAAIRIAKSARDDIWVNTATVRVVSPADSLAVGAASVGQWVPAPP